MRFTVYLPGSRFPAWTRDAPEVYSLEEYGPLLSNPEPGVIRVRVDDFQRDLRDLLEWFDSITPERAEVEFHAAPGWSGTGNARRVRQDPSWKTIEDLKGLLT